MQEYFKIILFSLFLKLLCFTAYYSTDFEVHRNWLRITHNLPTSEWYYDEKSVWTLDYPPLFAYFERILSIFAHMIDPEITQSELPYSNNSVVYFQRTTVIISELVFLSSLIYYFKTKNKNDSTHHKDNQLSMISFCFIQFGWILVDNIHFQYNSFMQGILVFSLTQLQKGSYVSGGILFAILLNFKHIFLYTAPVIFLYLLKSYCMQSNNGNIFLKINIKNLAILSFAVISVFIISFLPFLDLDQVKQIFSRMFPFQRGLVHAYWAPNFWSLYCFGDISLVFICNFLIMIMSNVIAFMKKILGIKIDHKSTLTSGVVQVTQFDVLPEIKPIITILLIVIISFVILNPMWIHLFRNQNRKQLLLLYSSVQMFIFYMFGFHVHEKAILLPLGIYQIYSAHNEQKYKYTLIFSFVSGIGLLPLLPEHPETSVKIVGIILYHLCYWAYLKHWHQQSVGSKIYLSLLEKIIILMGLVITIFGHILHPFLKTNQTFLPLMLHSVYGGLLNMWLFVRMYFELYSHSYEDSTSISSSIKYQRIGDKTKVQC